MVLFITQTSSYLSLCKIRYSCFATMLIRKNKTATPKQRENISYQLRVELKLCLVHHTPHKNNKRAKVKCTYFSTLQCNAERTQIIQLIEATP